MITSKKTTTALRSGLALAMALAAPTAATVVRSLRAGANICPTGARKGVWMEVDDDTGARGRTSSAFA